MELIDFVVRYFDYNHSLHVIEDHFIEFADGVLAYVEKIQVSEFPENAVIQLDEIVVLKASVGVIL